MELKTSLLLVKALNTQVQLFVSAIFQCDTEERKVRSKECVI